MANVNKLSLAILGGFALLAVLAFAITTKANPLEFLSESSATATTTLSYMTPGTATTTLSYDTYNSGNANTYATNNLALAVQFTASSTSATLLINEEFSQDGVDWYQGTQTTVPGSATTTAPTSLTAVPQYVWTFASSTIGQQAPAPLNNRDTRIVILPAPMRYARAIFTLKAGGTNGAIWATQIGQKQASR